MNFLYKTKKAPLLSALTLNDATYWGADMFVGVVFALYITQNIGGSAIDVGFAFGLYRIMRAVSAIPIGNFLDKHRGHLDEYYGLALSGVIASLVYFALFFAGTMTHVYLAMIVLGVTHALDVNTWKILFYSNLPKNAEGQVIGVYETTMQIVYGLSIITAGFVGELFGFEWTMVFAGAVAILSTFVLLSLHKERKMF